MKSSEYQAFLEYVFAQYVRGRSRWKHGTIVTHEWDYKADGAIANLRRAVATSEFIRNHCDDDSDVYHIFTPNYVTEIVSDVYRAVRFPNKIAEETGFFEALDSYQEEIVSGLDIEYLPNEDMYILQYLGSLNPKTELMAMIFLVKRRAARLARYGNNPSPSHESRRAEEILSSELESFRKSGENSNLKPPKKPRRWFKGLGQIAQGSALSIGNIALALGALSLPVSPETATWGAITSSATGMGMISNGIGELRGE